MKRPVIPALGLALILSGCAALAPGGTNVTKPAPVAAPSKPISAETKEIVTAPKPRATARTAAQFDTTTAEQKKAAAAPPKAAGETKLGTSIAGLGDPAEPGFWIKTSLVKTESSGRVVNPANGKSTKVKLLPLAGGGSQLSLPAIQLLGMSLTDLTAVEIYQD